MLWAGALLAELAAVDQTQDLLVALAGAVLLSVLLADLSLVIAALTPRRGFGVAAVITVLLVLVSVQGALQALGDEQGSAALSGWSGLLTPYLLVNGVLEWVFDAGVVDAPEPPGAAGGPVFLLVALGTAAACYGLLLLRYRRVSVS